MRKRRGGILGVNTALHGVLDDCWGHEVEGLKEGQGMRLLRGRWASCEEESSQLS